MPIAQSGGSTVTGAQVVDNSLGPDDLTSAAVLDKLPNSGSLVPKPEYTLSGAETQIAFDSDAVGFVARYYVPSRVTVSKITVKPTGTGTALTCRFAVFSADGQTRHINEAIALGTAANALVSHDLGTPVVLEHGTYYIAVVPATSEVGRTLSTWTLGGSGTIGSNHMSGAPTSQAKYTGTLVTSSGAMVATFDPVADITEVASRGVLCRFN
jgi:hypothetical protein